jgi:hypothetical protein
LITNYLKRLNIFQNLKNVRKQTPLNDCVQKRMD